MNERDILRLGSNGLGLHGGFLEGSSVFLYADGHMDDPVEVRYVLPEHWTVVAPTPRNADGAFTAAGYRSLIDTPVQFGEMTERVVPIDSFTVRLVFDQPLPPHDTAAFDANISTIIGEQTRLFGSRPFGDYTILVHWRPDLDFGGGMEHGRAMALPGPGRPFSDAASSRTRVFERAGFRRRGARDHRATSGPDA